MNSQKNREVICINLILITPLTDFDPSEFQHFGGEAIFSHSDFGTALPPHDVGEHSIHLLFNIKQVVMYYLQSSDRLGRSATFLDTPAGLSGQHEPCLSQTSPTCRERRTVCAYKGSLIVTRIRNYRSKSTTQESFPRALPLRINTHVFRGQKV